MVQFKDSKTPDIRSSHSPSVDFLVAKHSSRGSVGMRNSQMVFQYCGITSRQRSINVRIFSACEYTRESAAAVKPPQIISIRISAVNGSPKRLHLPILDEYDFEIIVVPSMMQLK